MPNSFEPVRVPDEMRGVEPEEEPRPGLSADFWRSLFSLLLMLTGVVAMTVGVWWWVHPGAGLAILGLGVTIIGFMIEFYSGSQE